MKYLPVAQETINRNHRDRLRNLERSSDRGGRPQTEEIAVFSREGAIMVRTTGKWRIRNGGQIVAVWFESNGGATGTSSFDVFYDGAALGSGVSVLSSDDSKSAYLGDFRAAAGHTLQIDVTAAGGHLDPSIFVVMKG